MLALALAPLSAWNVQLPQSWSNRLGRTLSPITTGVWAAERPKYRLGLIDVGSRMVLARSSDGSLVLHAPQTVSPEDADALAAGIDALGGGVGHIIEAGGRKATPAWSAAWPEAEVYEDDAPRAMKLPGRAPRAPPGFESATIDGVGEPFVGEPFFFHVESKALLCGGSWWNFPTGPRPAGEGAPGADATGMVHACPKVPCTEDVLPSARLPRRTRAWAALLNRLVWPVRRSLTSQGGLRLGGTVFFVGGRPPGAALATYQEQVERVLAWEPELLVPAHGDVLRGKEACRAALLAHYLPPSSRAAEIVPPWTAHDGGNADYSWMSNRDKNPIVPQPSSFRAAREARARLEREGRSGESGTK